jgi:hypothetical protein
MTADKASPTPTVLLGCSKCGAALPDEAQFCLKCGKPISVPSKNQPEVELLPPPAPPAPVRKRRLWPWLLLLLLVAGIAWVAFSDSDSAQAVQELFGWKQDQAVLETPFAVGPHTFRYYKFSLPEGSTSVAVVGEFSVTVDSQPANPRKGKGSQEPPDNNIEVFVLSESAFTIWQNGYATSSVYESGRVSQGKLQSDIPAGAGVYYLVFNNRFDPKTSKNIQANVLLRYKSWLPEWFRHLKETVTNWMGLN